MAGDCCVFKFLQGSVDGALQCFKRSVNQKRIDEWYCGMCTVKIIDLKCTISFPRKDFLPDMSRNAD